MAQVHAIDHIVHRTLADAVTRAERLFAGLRAAFCLAGLGAFLWNLGGSSPEAAVRTTIELSVAAMGVGFSLWVALRLRRRQLSRGGIIASVGLDAALACALLASNTIAPYPGYPGLLETLDVAVLPLVVATSALRVDRGAVITSGALCASGAILIVLADTRLGLTVDSHKATLLAFYLLAAVALAFFIAARARDIFQRVGRAAVRAEGARGGVLALLQDHHDVRSLLCDLQLNVDRLATAGGAHDVSQEQLARLQVRVRQGVTDLASATSKTRDRAMTALGGLASPEPADVRAACSDAATTARRQLEGLQVEVRVEAGLPAVIFGGGLTALTRQLVQLLINAAEGDPRGKADQIRLHAYRQKPGWISIEVRDNGPGFSKAMLEVAGRSHGTTTKVGSAGIGLWLARSAATAAGGDLQLENLSGGACVCITLPIWESSRQRPER